MAAAAAAATPVAEKLPPVPGLKMTEVQELFNKGALLRFSCTCGKSYAPGIEHHRHIFACVQCGRKLRVKIPREARKNLKRLKRMFESRYESDKHRDTKGATSEKAQPKKKLKPTEIKREIKTEVVKATKVKIETDAPQHHFDTQEPVGIDGCPASHLAAQASRRRKLETQLETEFPGSGWKIELCQRKTGATQGRWDAYWHGPKGELARSWVQAKALLSMGPTPQLKIVKNPEG